MKNSTDNENKGDAGCFARIYWMLIGNAMLVIAFAFLIRDKPLFPSFFDFLYLFSAGSLVVVRYVDIRHFNGGTGFGDPATMDDWRKYSIGLLIGSLGVWLVVRFMVPLF